MRCWSHAGGEADLEPECRADAGLALDTDPATHQLDDLLGDREAKPGAAEAASNGRVRLGEFLEELGAHGIRHADAGIGDLEDQNGCLTGVAVVCALRPHLDRYATLLGEFHGVPD